MFRAGRLSFGKADSHRKEAFAGSVQGFGRENAGKRARPIWMIMQLFAVRNANKTGLDWHQKPAMWMANSTQRMKSKINPSVKRRCRNISLFDVTWT